MSLLKSTIDDFKDYETLWESANTKGKLKSKLHEDLSSYSVGVDGSKKKIEKMKVDDTQALSEIVKFISGLTREEKENVWCSWFWVDENNNDQDIVVSIYSRAELEQDPEYAECGVYGDRTLGNWDYAERELQKALGIKSLY